ncbi:uncharacterized protein BCR38DRAFT_465809 [Pseudomassariella vexata]|uniref:C2 domain-containing protein n=1 Tax=Pseudomassariella vexata TaxID=1141098 RepID=A0A1Y2E1V6_9PEZI|nr:uncharacterized protein BCR38DRAFT_465809 [Pseudomassariella vexata]ORY65334.1 hypothetical protein BCR38DRAFT_465809 [Pseudomassariella vexata]
MAAKTKMSNPLNGMHTAGIFSDMSADGPEIGTLVLIADRAKNLPNRKTIGKQDPYCAARLGKEAKKTTTDIRGGQTPKWDQELRFTVHDSPDYYQLKISIFNDDKKTDLIGETWVDLRDVIVPGGGQNDQWQTLNFKGKYAGEVRIEVTFYDSRPKPEKPVAKPKPVASVAEADGSSGSQNGRSPVKRRPLPSNPGTEHAGAPPPKTAPAPEQVQTPSKPQSRPAAAAAANFIPNQSPLQAVEYNTPPPARYNQPEHYSPAPDHGTQYRTPPHRPDVQHHRSLDTNEKFSTYGDDRQYHPEPFPQSYEPESRTPYNHGQLTFESPSPHALQQRQIMPDDDRPPPPPAHRVRNNSGSSQELVHRGSLDTSPHKANPSMPMRHDVLRSEAHRYSISSVPSPSSSSNYPGRPTYRPYDSVPDVPRDSPHNDQVVVRQHHLHDSPLETPPRSLQPTVEDVPESWTPPNARSRRSNSRQEMEDELHFSQGASPAPLNLSGRGSVAASQYTLPTVQTQRPYGSNEYAISTSPVAAREPLRGNSIDYGMSTSPNGARDYAHGNSNDFGTSVSSGVARDYSRGNSIDFGATTSTSMVAARDYARGNTNDFGTSPSTAMVATRDYDRGNPSDFGNSSSTAMIAARDYPRGGSSHSYSNAYTGQVDPYGADTSEMDNSQALVPRNYAPPVPATLVPGVDPALSMEISTRFHEDRRQERRYTQPAPQSTTPTRGRQYSEPPNNYGAQSSSHGYYPSHSRNYGGSPGAYASGTNTPSGPPAAGNSRGPSTSPNPNHTIKRKSVSPAPPPREEGRRLSGVPFGPDSYDELNPSISSAKQSSKSNEYTNAYGKIVTPDGREVDPSDHLPMDTWAPEPEPREPKQKPEPLRPTPAGAQPMPPSGRRQLRIAARPQSMAAVPPPSYINHEVEPSPPPSSGRNRLQKKAHRVSALPAPVSAGSSPLGPATSRQRNSTPPRALVRASTFDYENNHDYGGSPGASRSGMSGPPIPAKVPLMSGGLGASPGMNRGDGEDWALMEEMSRIDIGSGRARRHGGY